MGKVRMNMMMSLDGYVAGPDQTAENPFGVGGMKLNAWLFDLEAFSRMQGGEGGEVNASTPVVESWLEGVGATVMGRNMFGGGPGDWGDGSWTGFWGDDPPYHHQVFVLTHHPRESVEMRGGTTFHFVTEGIEPALERAREAAGDLDVAIGGGATAIQQYLAAGLLDELLISLVPVFLGDGSRLFEELGEAPPSFEQTELVPAPGVSHLRYRRIEG